MSHAAPLPTVRVRPASLADLDSVLEFNLRLAEETEGLALDPAVLRQGVEQALRHANRITYWIAEAHTGTAIGQAGITTEWSDWRNGWIWWLQSVYVAPIARGQGVFREIVRAIEHAARTLGNVVGLRLYVEQENERAQAVYRSCGLQPGGYLVMERFWPNSAETARPGDPAVE